MTLLIVRIRVINWAFLLAAFVLTSVAAVAKADLCKGPVTYPQFPQVSRYCSNRQSGDCKAAAMRAWESLELLTHIHYLGIRSADGSALISCWKGVDEIDLWLSMVVSSKEALVGPELWYEMAIASSNEVLKYQMLNNLVGSLFYKPAIAPLVTLVRGDDGELPRNTFLVLSEHPDSDQGLSALQQAVRVQGFPYTHHWRLFGLVDPDQVAHRVWSEGFIADMHKVRNNSWKGFLTLYLITCLMPWRLFLGWGHPADWSQDQRFEELETVFLHWISMP